MKKKLLFLMILGVIMSFAQAGGVPVYGAANGPSYPDYSFGPAVQVTESAGNASGSVGRTFEIDADNVYHIVYTEVIGNKYDVYYIRSEDQGNTWSEPKNLSEGSLPALSPTIALGPDQALHVVWNDCRNGEIKDVYYTRSLDGGLTWETAVNISGDLPKSASSPQVTVDAKNRVHIAWHVGDPETDVMAEVYYARSTDGGRSFSSPQRLNQGDGHAAYPRFALAAADDDLIAVAWRDNRRNPDWDVYLAVSEDGGATFTEKIGAASSVRNWDPEVLVDEKGTIHLTYMDYTSKGIKIIYRRSYDHGDTFTKPVTLSEGRSRFSSWSYDARNNILWLFWKDERNTQGRGKKIVSNIAGKYSKDKGQTWSGLQFITDYADKDPKFPSNVIDPSGNPHSMWNISADESGREQIFMTSGRQETDGGKKKQQTPIKK